MADYSYTDIVKSLREAGLKEGDSVFTHSSLGFFGRLEGAQNAEDLCVNFKNAFPQEMSSQTFLIPQDQHEQHAGMQACRAV